MILSGVCLLAALASGTFSTSKHPGPPVFLELHLEGGGLSAVLNGEQSVLWDWFGMEEPPGVTWTEVERAQVLSAARGVLPQMAALEVNGQRVLAQVRSVDYLGPYQGAYGAEPSLLLQLDYELLEAPHQVSLEWSLFPEDSLGGVPRLPVHLLGAASFDYVVLTAEEPSWTWHRDLSDTFALPPVAPVEVRSRPVLRSMTLLILGLAAGLAVSVFGSHQGRSLMIGLGGIFLAGVWSTSGAGALALPGGSQSLVISESLMRRVYAAFDSTTEEGIYRLLASSVEPELLDSLYQGILGSLVQADQGGGARGRVESLEITQAELRPRVSLSGRPAFGVQIEWVVGGLVVHFGHEHSRRVRYGGLATIVAGQGKRGDGASWRLAGLDIHSSVREEGGSGMAPAGK